MLRAGDQLESDFSRSYLVLFYYIAVCFFNREQTVHILYFHSSWDCDEPQLIDSRNISITKVLSKIKMNFNCASKCWNLVDISTYFVRYISTICTNNYLCFYSCFLIWPKDGCSCDLFTFASLVDLCVIGFLFCKKGLCMPLPRKGGERNNNILVRSFVVIAIDSVFVRPSTFVIVDFSIFFDAVRETLDSANYVNFELLHRNQLLFSYGLAISWKKQSRYGFSIEM